MTQKTDGVSVAQALATAGAVKARGIADRTLEVTMGAIAELAQGKRPTLTIERVDAVVVLEAIGKLREEIEILRDELKTARAKATVNESYRMSAKAVREIRTRTEALKVKLEEYMAAEDE